MFDVVIKYPTLRKDYSAQIGADSPNLILISFCKYIGTYLAGFLLVLLSYVKTAVHMGSRFTKFGIHWLLFGIGTYL